MTPARTSNRVVITTVLLALLASILSTTPVYSAMPQPGKICLKLGTHVVANGLKLSCVKLGSKLVWTNSVKAIAKEAAPTQAPAPTPSPTKSTAPKSPQFANAEELRGFVNLAKSAMSNQKNQLPTLDTDGIVKIDQVGSNILSNFLMASSTTQFTILGPTPLLETDASRIGSLSLITKDHKMVYQSQSALAPWAVSFNLTTTDPQGRLIVKTSGLLGSRNPEYAWRLVFKTSNGAWKYKTISGQSHPNNDVQYFDEVTLGSAGTFSIRLEFEATTTFYGIGLNDAGTAVSPLTSKVAPRVLVLGDSWVSPGFNETGPVHVWDAFPGALSWLTGWNVISAGVGGQGYLQIAAGETYKDRVVRDLVPQSPDVVIFTGSPNDPWGPGKFSASKIAAEMASDIRLLQQADPTVLIIVCSPFFQFDNQQDLMRKEAFALGVSIVDFTRPMLFDEVNNGQNQLANGHPTRTGSGYIAAELLKRIAGLL